ncbi:MAG: rifampicin phosphotransferase [Pseudonocardiales bacterium]|nr:rifampicin phosphotransferase [Pseudonocardiales bacterium]MDT7623949.1 rifampicin phosphotransferase [Pseudonocardiales bacterium]
MSNPLHEVGSPTTAWTTVNTAENFPGVATPLGWTFWRDPLERGMKGAFHDMGVLPGSAVTVPESIDDRFSAAVFGRFAANVDCLRRMADRMPGTSGEALEAQLLGSVRPGVPSYPSRRRYPVVAAKMPAAVVRLPRRLHRLRAETDAWWRAVTAPGAIATAARARAVLAESAARFEAVMRPHAFSTLLGTGIYDQVAALATASGHPGLETSLVTGYGDVEEAQAAGELWRVARGELTLAEFLADHGYHAPTEAEISSRSWREDDAPLRRLIEQYAGLPESASPVDRARRQRQEREDAEARVLAGTAGPARAGARLRLALARRYIPLREVGKAAFLQTIDGGRAAARYLGAELVAGGELTEPGEVYFLTVEELTGVRLPAGVGELVARRRATFEEYRALRLPDKWVGEPQPLAEPVAGPGAAVTRVTGMAVSPGVVEGVARVVHSAEENDLEPGEILVCKTTDPSWASYFVVASAVVIDIGGPLSHGAIVARELGVPCVINTGNGTRAIRSGDYLRVDGGAGTVEILLPALTEA